MSFFPRACEQDTASVAKRASHREEQETTKMRGLNQSSYHNNFCILFTLVKGMWGGVI